MCNNQAHKNGMCKFHLDGYLNGGTADEVRNLFWKKYDDGDADSVMDCTGYILPSLARHGRTRTVERQLRMDGARFALDIVDFSQLTFEQEVSFNAAKFEAGADFSGCEFKMGVDFSFAEFSNGDTKFATAKFHKTANFFRTRFDRVSFEWAFFEKAQFNQAHFRMKVSFDESVFDSTANFHRARFLEESNFEKSEIHSGADFSDAEFKKSMYFRDVEIRCPALVKFDGNVSNVSFLNTDVKEITLGSRITWSPYIPADKRRSRLARFRLAGNRPKPHSAWNRKWRIHDERMLDATNYDRALNVENVMNTYRDLRDNCDRQLRYDVSGGFFVREMEMERKYENGENGNVVPKPLLRRVVTWHAAYNTLSEYGQSLIRPLAFLVPILVVGSALLWCSTEVLRWMEIPCEDDLAGSAFRTLISMVPLPFFGVESDVDLGVKTAIDLGLKVAAIPPSATFLIALRRRFEKSRRH